MSNVQIRQEIASNPTMKNDLKKKLKSEIMTRYSFSMACLAFAFVGVPLGMQSHRSDTSRGLMVSVLIGTGYFLITMMADQVKSGAAAAALLWAPNVLCVVFGLFLFRRARFSR
jgi:lipopolysaccharide export system permease protein